MDGIAAKSTIFLLNTPWCTDAYIVQGETAPEKLMYYLYPLPENRLCRTFKPWFGCCGQWNVLQNQFSGSGERYRINFSGAVGMMGHKNYISEVRGRLSYQGAPLCIHEGRINGNGSAIQPEPKHNVLV